MGVMRCAGLSLEFEDRVLTHLQIVVVQHFRRGEAFLMSWANAAAHGSGRGSLWLTPSVPVAFEFSGSRVPAIDQSWIDRLNSAASSPRGLIVVGADGALVHPSASPRWAVRGP